MLKLNKNLLITFGISLAVPLSFIGTILLMSPISNAQIKIDNNEGQRFYDSLMKFSSFANDPTSEKTVSIISFTYDQKNARVQFAMVGNEHVFTYSIYLKDKMSANNMIEWFNKGKYETIDYESEVNVYLPYDIKPSRTPDYDSITYIAYETEPEALFFSGTYKRDNTYYSFVNYSVNQYQSISETKVKYSINKSQPILYSLFTLIMQ